MTFSSSPLHPDVVCRGDVLKALSSSEPFDMVVVGGGIHGAAAARLAAGLGFRVALLEKADYAAATSSRSSKMAHGGLRYLELFDFEQVFEGIKAREEMFERIGHLVKPADFLIPVPKHAWWFRTKLSIGLSLYDLLVKRGARRHRWIPRRKLNYPGFHADRANLMGCFLYTDGIMSDARVVFENILGARRYGAYCLNYCEVTSVQRDENDLMTLFVRDCKGAREFSVRAKVVLNCAGPWASSVAQSLGAEGHPLKFSRGSHIIFNTKWTGPSLFLPMPGKARYYFVWPHPAGTLVGTTEREVSGLELDPVPSGDEIEEILSRLQKDIPDAGLTRENAVYCFAGIRTLPTRGKSSSSSVLSRKHVWTQSRGIINLFGGKYTTASWTALEGVKAAAKYLGREITNRGLKTRPDLKELPGSMRGAEESLVRERLAYEGISTGDQERLVGRYGRRLMQQGICSGTSGNVERIVEEEVSLALQVEQAESLEDVLRRRLELEYTEDHGERYMRIIREVFSRLRPDIDFDKELSMYRERMKRVSHILGKPALR